MTADPTRPDAWQCSPENATASNHCSDSTRESGVHPPPPHSRPHLPCHSKGGRSTTRPPRPLSSQSAQPPCGSRKTGGDLDFTACLAALQQKEKKTFLCCDPEEELSVLGSLCSTKLISRHKMRSLVCVFLATKMVVFILRRQR